MSESTKIELKFRHISQISDFTELIEILFPNNRNQQHAAGCIFLELKWCQHIVPNLSYLEAKYNISRRILQRSRAKLSKLGVIEHVSCFNSRYGGQQGWKLSSRFERSLNQLARKCFSFRDTRKSSKDKDKMLLAFMDTKRSLQKHATQVL